jgi:hypothetical protein
MNFNFLLRASDLGPENIALCFHMPGDRKTRQALLTVAEERPDLFEAYQSTHGRVQEATVRRRPFFASFVMTEPGELTFIGLYSRTETRRLTAKEFLADATFREMLERTAGHNMDPQDAASMIDGRMKFDLRRMRQLSELSRRLVVTAPRGRNYVRLAETTELQILEMKRIARVIPPMPAWDELALSRSELLSLPREWAARLAEWRGIYLLVDETDGARYVGAAYGEENLFGRWRSHIAAEVGVTAELRERQTSGLRFSILELLSPTATIEEVTAREQSWMRRLHTREFGLNA